MRKFLRGLVGFFLTILLMLVTGLFCFIATLRFSTFNCSSLTEFINRAKFYESVNGVIIEEMVNNSDELGLSENAIRAMFPDKLITDTANHFIDALESDKKVDLSYLKDDTTDYTDRICNAVVEETFLKLEDRGDLLSEDALDGIEELNQFEEDYNVNVSKVFIKEINDIYKSDALDISDKNKDKVRKQLNKALVKTVNPQIENAFDEYIDMMNESVNDFIDELDEEAHIRDIVKSFSKLLTLLKIAVIINAVLIGILVLFELLLYKKEVYRGFKHSGTGIFLPAFISLALGIIIDVLDTSMIKEFDMNDKAQAAAATFIDYNVSMYYRASIIISVILLVIAIVLKIVGGRLKKAYKRALLNQSTVDPEYKGYMPFDEGENTAAEGATAEANAGATAEANADEKATEEVVEPVAENTPVADTAENSDNEPATAEGEEPSAEIKEEESETVKAEAEETESAEESKETEKEAEVKAEDTAEKSSTDSMEVASDIFASTLDYSGLGNNKSEEE